MNRLENDPVYTTKELAEYLGLKPQTLASWRCKGGKGPSFIKSHRKILYRYSDVEEFLEENKFENTAQSEAKRLEISPSINTKMEGSNGH